MTNSSRSESIKRFVRVGIFVVSATFCAAQMKTGSEMTGFGEAFGVDGGKAAKDFAVQETGVRTASSAMVNVLWPGESAQLTFHFTNKTHTQLRAAGTIRVVAYRTSVPQGDVWVPHVFKIADGASLPITLDIPPGGFQDVTISPEIPERFGGYGLVADIQDHGSVFLATLVRATKPDQGRVQFPTYALDMTWDEFMNEGIFVLFQKLGIKGARMGGAFNPKADPEYAKSEALLDRYMQWAQKHDVTVMLTLGDGEAKLMQPMGRPRPWLTADGKMLDTKDDRAWLPSYDQEFQSWVQDISTRYGWPKGNLNAVELWNEPWEGISISGWQGDIPRYRDIYARMAQGVEAARAKAGVKVLIGGTCSSSNTRDKLFSDGSDKFLRWLDFVSIHYQALAAEPSEVPEWMNRKGPYGAVRVWDTESWIANSEDRVAGVIASMRAQGQSRTAGIYDGNVYDSKNVKIRDRVYPVVQAWAPAAAVAATQKFIGQRNFRELLFQNGLPWVFVFDGRSRGNGEAPDPDDGTVVVVGDLGKIYEPERTSFRSVKVAADAHMIVSDANDVVQLFDFYGNRVSREGSEITVPLDGRGFFLRANGKAGSFAKLLDSIRQARVVGVDAVEIVAHDLTGGVASNPEMRLSLTNVLNRPVEGRLQVSLEGAQLQPLDTTIHLNANETRDVTFRVERAQAVSNNLYRVIAEFDGGPDGKVVHQEDLRANVIAKRTIKVDGDLEDWQGVLPQVLPGVAIGPGLTEEAWLPFKNFSKEASEGLATTYLAYDEENLYFAAKILDSTADPGMVRFARRDDDSYFYPDHASGADGAQFTWPDGVRHYSYRKNVDIPSGSGEHDNVLIAFNVLDKKPWLPHPPGVMPKFITYWDTDYEYALNPVAEEYGGGTEIWRLLAPGMPRKHFFPRQPKSPIDGGPVEGGNLVIRREGNTRIVEASIPWSEMPEVKSRLLSGQTVKFTCRVNDNKGPAHELAAGRSVSKLNSVTFHDDWQDHWANELEFRAEK